MAPKDPLDDYLKRMEDWDVPREQSADRLWEKVEKRIDHPQKARMKKMIPALAAAGVLLIAGLHLVLSAGSSARLEAPAGKQISETLPDGSTVYLNAGSQLKYRKRLLHNDHWVKLDGEAFFEVKNGTDFKVEASNWLVEVKGTRFNVVARQHIRSVSCYGGAVRIEVEGHEPHTLQAGNEWIWKNGRLYMNKLQPASPQWLHGQIRFRKEKLRHVFQEVERQFDVSVSYDGPQDRLYTGGFSNKSLESALQSICKPMELTYAIDEEQNSVHIKHE